MRHIVFAFHFVLVLFVLSCSSIPSVVEEPKVSLSAVEISGIDIDGVKLIARVNVENPNAFPIPLPRIDWDIFINTAPFIKGSVKDDKTITGRGKTTLDIPLSVDYEGLYRSFKSLIETREAAYDLALGITFPIPLIESKVYKLDFSGVLPLPELPMLSPGAVKISKIDFSGIELEWPVNVENPNTFPIPFPGLDWNYLVNGVSLVKGRLSREGEIAAGSAAATAVKLSIAYADVFRVANSARNSGEVKSDLSLETGIPIPGLEELRNSVNIPGVLPILRLPSISFGGISRRSLGTTMEFVLSLVVENRNSFALDIGSLDYDFSVNTRSWAKGALANTPRLEAGRKTDVQFSVSVSAASLVRELVDILNRGAAVSYSFTGNMNLSGALEGLGKIDVPLDLRGSTRIR